MREKSAGPWLTAGLTSASTSSISTSAIASGRGGIVRARGTRCVCIHRAASIASGMPMCRNDSRENSLSVIPSGSRKLRTIVPRKAGSTSNHSAVVTTTYWASWSHGSM